MSYDDDVVAYQKVSSLSFKGIAKELKKLLPDEKIKTKTIKDWFKGYIVPTKSQQYAINSLLMKYLLDNDIKFKVCLNCGKLIISTPKKVTMYYDMTSYNDRVNVICSSCIFSYVKTNPTILSEYYRQF